MLIKSTLLQRFSILLLFINIALPSPIQAQPGWIDYTKHYNYTILNKKGRKISFRKKKAYEIRIDSLSFSGSSIPNDPLEPAIENVTNHFENYFRINDCSFRRPQNGRAVKIQIIHRKDTMHLYQAVGKVTLQFHPGYYHLWPGYFADDFAAVSGKVKIKNAHQSNFLIPRKLYLANTTLSYFYEEAKKEADELVFNNFMKAAGLQVNKKIAATQFDRSFSDYKDPRWEYAIYPTKDQHLYFGLVRYTFSSSKQYATKHVFSIFDKEKNSISHWAPKERLSQFATYGLKVDTFNNTLHHTTRIREKYGPNCKVWHTPECPYEQKWFCSYDEGKSWVEDSLAQQLFTEYGLNLEEFLDEEHALAFRLKEITDKRPYPIKQGIYYLVKGRQLIDSLPTPDTVDYRNNYNRYQFSRVKDTIQLGRWITDPFRRQKKKRWKHFYQPLLIKHNGQWRFEILKEPMEKYYNRNKVTHPEAIFKAYQNFKLRDNRVLEFNNGAGTLTLNSDVFSSTNYAYIPIVENGSHIYLLHGTFTLLSFDGGTSWYVYPKALNKRGEYRFLEANQQKELSFFNLRKMQKVVYQFSNQF